MEIDMTRPVEGGNLIGINLWEVKSVEVTESRSSGDRMLRFKLKCGSTELNDIAMLAGRGWAIGREKLIALGLDPNFKGSLDPTQFINKRVWVATKPRPYEGKDGTPRVGSEVDIDQLKHKGYQAESDVPPGCVAPPAADEDVPW